MREIIANKTESIPGREGNAFIQRKAGTAYKQPSLQMLFGSLAIVVTIMIVTVDP